MYIVYMGALMAGFGLNFFLAWLICMYQKKWSRVGKRMGVCENDRDCAVIYVISASCLKL